MSKYELLLKDKNRGSHEEFIQNLALIGRYESEDEYDQDENIKIGVAKVELDKPYVCWSLKPAKRKERTMFRAKQIQVY